jgi:glucose/arabinose dehydrogenase
MSLMVIEEVGTGFDAPVLLVANPDRRDDGTVAPDMVVEQPGRIVTLDHRVLLDITRDVIYDGEQGLLGLAFHPNFGVNRLAYVNYVGEGRRTVIEQFAVAEDGSFDVGSRKSVLTVDQPAPNHNGGMIAFGPDGYLWIGMGDGGGSNDRYRTAQDPHNLLGSMLRIVVGVEGADPYGIPPDNPFADGEDGAPEVWATGLRNPWRFAFDGGSVWIADVGQDAVEEVDVVDATTPGLNFGWPLLEGTRCRAPSCEGDFVLPVTQYDHDDGCSITGGYVYRGEGIPSIDGLYFYSDFCGGFLRSWSVSTGDLDWNQSGVGAVAQVSGFGIGGDGELYMLSLGGVIHRLACCEGAP